jgi:general secretion pathway protein G
LAIASLVCGIVGPCTLGLASIAGIILGIVGLKKIKAGGGAVGGRGLAIAGIIVSVVTLIIGLILAVILGGALLFAPRFKGRSEQAKIAAAHVDIDNLQVALDAFELDFGRYPSTEECLKVLIDPPQDPTRWRGPYLKRSPKDAWGNSYMYRFPGRHNTNGYDLYSFGPDGQEGGGDDIDNWSRR